MIKEEKDWSLFRINWLFLNFKNPTTIKMKKLNLLSQITKHLVWLLIFGIVGCLGTVHQYFPDNKVKKFVESRYEQLSVGDTTFFDFNEFGVKDFDEIYIVRGLTSATLLNRDFGIQGVKNMVLDDHTSFFFLKNKEIVYRSDNHSIAGSIYIDAIDFETGVGAFSKNQPLIITKRSTDYGSQFMIF